MKRLTFICSVVVLILMVTSACSSKSPDGGVKLAPLSALPPQIQSTPVAVREAYQFALANQEVLQKIPCYCGCGAEGHTSVKDCFVQEVRADGTVIWDEMGLG